MGHWLIIEGDNGVGKDTLADLLATQGWTRVDGPRISAALTKARGLAGMEKVKAFLLYNEECRKVAAASPGPVVQVRYWPSTLAAGFRDGHLLWNEMLKIKNVYSTVLPQPTHVIYLCCRHKEHHRRILDRGPVRGNVDAISDDAWIRSMNELLTAFDVVKIIDTTMLSCGQIAQVVLDHLKESGHDRGH